MAFYQFEREQYIQATQSEVWDFISSPQNLKKITPAYMDFEIRSKNIPDKIHEGMIISYTVRPVLGIATNWVTEITHVANKQYFVDEQRIGPYRLWHHQHRIKETNKGILMHDIISYNPGYGFLGNIANKWFIKNKLNAIFEYRRMAFETIFPAQ